MHHVLRPFIGKFVVSKLVVFYFDDILVYSLSLKDHNQHVKQVLETLRKEKLYANMGKCVFAIDHDVIPIAEKRMILDILRNQLELNNC